MLAMQSSLFAKSQGLSSRQISNGRCDRCLSAKNAVHPSPGPPHLDSSSVKKRQPASTWPANESHLNAMLSQDIHARTPDRAPLEADILARCCDSSGD